MAGLEQGKKFYDAARNNQVSEEQQSKIPIIVKMLLAGPNVDFYLGRMWQAFEDDMTEKVTETCGLCDSDQLQHTSRRLYNKMNCELML